MRNLSSHITAAPSFDEVCSFTPAPLRNSTAASQPLQTPQSSRLGYSNSAFSQKTRRSVVDGHTRSAIRFIDKQHAVIKDLIKQLQIFVGYREQLNLDSPDSPNPDSWSVYLMHAQSLNDAINQSFLGKKLFGNGAQPPIRLHVTIQERVEPFELPDPCLGSYLTLRSFLAGVNDHSLPSISLINACIAELLNALVEIQNGRSALSKIAKRMEEKPSVRLIHHKEQSFLQASKDPETNWFTKALSALGITPTLIRGVPFFARP